MKDSEQEQSEAGDEDENEERQKKKNNCHKIASDLYDFLELIHKTPEEFHPRTFPQYERCFTYISAILVNAMNVKIPEQDQKLVYITKKCLYYHDALKRIYEECKKISLLNYSTLTVEHLESFLCFAIRIAFEAMTTDIRLLK